jgi:hypothetical protein
VGRELMAAYATLAGETVRHRSAWILASGVRAGPVR